VFVTNDAAAWIFSLPRQDGASSFAACYGAGRISFANRRGSGRDPVSLPILTVPEGDETLSIRAVGPELAVRLLALVGSGLVVAATFVPSNGGGRAGYPYAIFDTSIQREFQLFAAEPIGAALFALGAAFLFLRRTPLLAAGLLLALGAQSFLLFSAHLGVAAFGNPQYNSFRPGGLLGMVGALSFIAAGSLVLQRAGWPDRRAPSVQRKTAGQGASLTAERR
jgi:hypothetical protein